VRVNYSQELKPQGSHACPGFFGAHGLFALLNYIRLVKGNAKPR
jgi:hypothetical protein